MTQPTHTPAPWTYEIDKCGMINFRIYERGGLVADVYHSEKNARLIAAAPDLLEALEGLFNSSDVTLSDESAEVWKNAKLAIAKARG